MEEKIKARIAELEKIRMQMVANLNATEGAIIELTEMLKQKTPSKATIENSQIGVIDGKDNPAGK